MRDEHPEYVIEWIEYHRHIGFDLIRIYDNGSVKPMIDSLRAFYKGVPAWLEVIAFVGKHKHLPAYTDSIVRGGAQWMAFFDADEFLVLPHCSLVELLNGCTGSGLVVNWMVYTSNGEIDRRPALQVERFTEMIPGMNQHSIKSIVRMDLVDRPGSTHFFEYKSGNAMTVFGNKHPGGYMSSDISWPVARLNHYCVRSVQDFEEKLRRGHADGGAPSSGLLCEQGFPDRPTDTDATILDRWPAALRRELSRGLYGPAI